jgi:hypothetical protein
MVDQSNSIPEISTTRAEAITLHDIDIPSWAVERVIKRRGAEHVFTDLDPARTALIAIDMQNAFMLPGVAFVEIKAAPTIVPNINRLALTAFYSTFGDIMPTEMLVDLLGRG